MRDQRSGAGVITVVVADDHPIVRDGVMGMLASDSRIAVVAEAASGPEAVAQVVRHDPDVVLMDLRMPGGDGVAAIGEIRRGGGPRPAIIVLTTYETDRDIHSAIDAGANGYILKALGRQELIDAVVDAAAGRSVLAPAAAESLMTRRQEEQLTVREIEVLQQIAAGGTNRSVAQQLVVSESTVKTHLLHIYSKLKVRDRAAAVRVAFEKGLL